MAATLSEGFLAVCGGPRHQGDSSHAREDSEDGAHLEHGFLNLRLNP